MGGFGTEVARLGPTISNLRTIAGAAVWSPGEAGSASWLQWSGRVRGATRSGTTTFPSGPAGKEDAPLMLSLIKSVQTLHLRRLFG